jgi:hypothetical protein
MAPAITTDAELDEDVLSLKDDLHQPSRTDSPKSPGDEAKQAFGASGVAVLKGDDDSESSVDLQERGTGAVVLPWRVKVPALVLVIFFTCKPSASLLDSSSN